MQIIEQMQRIGIDAMQWSMSAGAVVLAGIAGVGIIAYFFSKVSD